MLNPILRFVRWLKYMFRIRRMKNKDPFIY